ncbi:MAG: hypothetical protein HFG35_06005 [Eubacterium sp.]|jgi:hypothetical protein|nr:hypothetical protein [Eubacterium sp.]
MSYHNKVFAFVSVLVIIFCTSCVSNEETSTTSNTTALEKDIYVCREIAHPKNNKASDLGWGQSMINSSNSFSIMAGAFPAAGVSHCTKYEYLSGKWDKLQIPVTTGEDILTAFYKSESGKLYGRVVNRETNIYIDAEDNQTDSEEIEEAFLYIINEEDGSAEKIPVKKWKGIEFIDNLEWEGVIKDQYSIFYDYDKKIMYAYDFVNQKVAESWGDVSLKDVCATKDGIYGINSSDTTQISFLKLGAEEPEELMLPGIRKAVAVDVVDEMIFILAQDGIYEAKLDSDDAFEKIYEKNGLIKEDEYLYYRVIAKDDGFIFYLASRDENRNVTFYEIKK